MHDRVILGDNQFFGINHMSQEKARAQAMKFQDLEAILDVIDVAYECGIRAFMFTTHDRVRDITDHVRANLDRYEGIRFYPVMPYAHKYANAVADKGMVGALRDVTAGNALSLMWSGGRALVGRDARSLVRVLVDAEMTMFRDLETPVIYLQNIVTDLLLGLGLTEAFVAYDQHVRERYGAEPGFITLNQPRLVDALIAAGLERPVVCSSINKIGYLMNPGRDACEASLARDDFRPVAMSILASGAVPARDAVEYVARFPSIESVVFGASSRRNIEHTVRLLEEFGLPTP